MNRVKAGNLSVNFPSNYLAVSHNCVTHTTPPEYNIDSRACNLLFFFRIICCRRFFGIVFFPVERIYYGISLCVKIICRSFLPVFPLEKCTRRFENCLHYLLKISRTLAGRFRDVPKVVRTSAGRFRVIPKVICTSAGRFRVIPKVVCTSAGGFREVPKVFFPTVRKNIIINSNNNMV